MASEIVVVQTTGDRDRSRSLHELPGSGFFTKELQSALLANGVDLVVHSLKDLPTDEPDGLTLGAILERQDPNELLLVRNGCEGDGPLGIAPGSVLGTSSLRRAAQALALRPDLRIKPLRGNVPTRLRKLADGDYDAILIAAAGIDRLGLDVGAFIARRLALEMFLPAPGQGALAVEVRAGDDRVHAAVAVLHDATVAEETACERALLKGLGGGCHLPLGAHARRRGERVELIAVLGELDPAVTRATVRRAGAAGPDAHTTAARALAQLREESAA